MLRQLNQPRPALRPHDPFYPRRSSRSFFLIRYLPINPPNKSPLPGSTALVTRGTQPSHVGFPPLLRRATARLFRRRIADSLSLAFSPSRSLSLPLSLGVSSRPPSHHITPCPHLRPGRAQSNPIPISSSLSPHLLLSPPTSTPRSSWLPQRRAER